ncbi:multiubiquitin domain-containing protein [Chryseobacterium oryctis]|uniref:Multiubiquitin domain-containing protein n=1 Tax=Chryseobacterium oryctis TaxID=2952618 RepID=A0ABT3HNG1_9FLAO|nr:multiubiquitin domain-containing protein [Chryseobacterium oryctis]MCW3161307.1 multiubiquitin domain-containing protein [Chryseobacterium oryctis]
MELDINSVNSQNNGNGKKPDVVIYVNGRENVWNEKEINFVQIIKIAFGNFENSESAAYTVAFKRGQGNKPEGVLNLGESVKVKDKMIFNATRTDKS